MHFYTCRCCHEGKSIKEKHTHWDVCLPQKTPHHGGDRKKVETHSLLPPDPTLNPALHHHSNNIMNRSKNADGDILTLSFLRTTSSKKDGKASLQAIFIPLPMTNIDSTISNNDMKKLTFLFQLLHPLLVLPSKQRFQHKYKCFSSDSESGKTLFEAASVDNTCLFQCIYSLATGKSLHHQQLKLQHASQQGKKIYGYKFLEL